MLHWHGLTNHDSWLLIYDNATNPKELKRYLPKGKISHILLTARHPRWDEIARPIALITLLRPESIKLLNWQSTPLLEDEQQQAATLAARLGDFPLALVQARAFMADTGVGLEGYLERY